MVLRRIFPNMVTAPDSAPAQSRNATIYLLRCIFVMGIQTPPQHYFFAYCLWSLFLNLSSTFYQPIGFLMGYISHLSELSPGEFLTSLQVSLNIWTCSIKVGIVWWMVKRFDQANQILDEMDKRLLKPSERKEAHRAVSSSNFIFFCYMAVYMSYATITTLSTVAFGRPPYQNYYPGLDWRANTESFLLQAGLEYFAMLVTCFQDAVVDFYPINYVVPLRAHLTNFAERLRQLGNNPEEDPEERYEKLIDCIKDYKIILRFCDTLRPMISGTIFVQLLVVGLVLGFTIINIVMFANLGSRIAALIFMTAVVLETTPFCILCNYLMDDCFKLADALFESNWIEQDQRYKKTVLQFLQSLQRPIIFMAGNFMTISVATNLNFSILDAAVLVTEQATKFSFSVFTLVKQMNIAERLAKPSE